MVKLGDMRRRFPVEDPVAYAAAAAEAELAGRLGELVHRMREAAGLGGAELAGRLGITADDLTAAEEGDPSLALDVGFLHRACVALGARGEVVIGGEHVMWGAAATDGAAPAPAPGPASGPAPGPAPAPGG
jgi:hypothetical protein